MTRRGLALVSALVLAVAVAGSCAVLTGGGPVAWTGSAAPSASRAATQTAKPGAKRSAKPGVKPGAKPTPKAVASVRMTGTGSRTSKPLLLAGDYALRDTIVTAPGCHWQVFLDGSDTAPMDEVMTNATGSTANEVDLIRLPKRSYTLRVVASKCSHWLVTLASM